MTEVSSVTFRILNLVSIATGSSVTWQRNNLQTLTWSTRIGVGEGRKKLAEIKAKVFDPKTKKERVERALKLLSKIKPIEGIDTATWKSIAEETAFEDTYGD